MNELEILDEELEASFAALEAGDDKPCGCGNKTEMESENPFGMDAFSESDELENELQLALDSFDGGAGTFSGDPFSSDNELELAMMGETSQITLENLIALTERNPGLKITLSQT